MMWLIFTLIFSQNVFAETEIEKGQMISSQCSSCHGEKGISENDEWPNLAGQKKTYMIEQLKNFKSEKRNNEIMSPIAQTLSEQEMDYVSQYYASLKK